MVDGVREWLLEGDPAIRWQAERDLFDVHRDEWARTRELVRSEGWGRRLLEEQDPSGRWADGLYSPKWTSTTYTLLLLRRFGLPADDAQARRGCRRLLDDAEWIDGGVSYWRTHRFPELCVNAMVLSVCAYFGIEDERVGSIADLLLRSRLDDGGWNCRDPREVSHSSFHTSISVLEALDIWRSGSEAPAADDAIAAGREFMLDHHMFRSHRTGEVIDEVWLEPHFPPRWHYDVLRGLDHLRASGADPDDRCREAIDVVTSGRRPDGRWGKGPQYGGRTFFALEPGRVAGRWNTLRALRVLAWWNRSA